TGIESRFQHQLIGRQDTDNSAAFEICPKNVGEFQCRFAEKIFTAFTFQRQQCSLNRCDGLRADQSVVRGDVVSVFRDESEQCTKVVKVEQQKTAVIGEFEGDLENTGLGVIQFEYPAQQIWTNFTYSRAHGMSRLAVQIPEKYWTCLVRVAFD